MQQIGYCASEKCFLVEGRHGPALLHGRMQRELLPSPVHLPGTQRQRGGERGHGRQGDDPQAHLAHACHGLIALMKYLVLLGFVAIIGSLGSALVFMMRDGQGGKPKTSNMARALAFRVGFSILLFVCILVAWKLGYIQPTGIPAGK